MSHYFIYYHVMKNYAEGTSAVEGCVWSASHTGHFTPEERRRYPLHRRLDGPQRLSGCCGVPKILPSLMGNRTPAVQPAASCYTDRVIPGSFNGRLGTYRQYFYQTIYFSNFPSMRQESIETNRSFLPGAIHKYYQ
jgi:hypothetical protein